MQFSNSDRCLCNFLTITTGTMTVAVIQAVELYILMMFAVWKFYSIVFLTFAIVVVFLHAVCLASLFMGLSKEQHDLLIPHLVYQALRLATLLMTEFGILVAPIVTLNPETYYDYDIFHGPRTSFSVVTGMVVLVILIVAVVFIFDVWFFSVTLHCFKYIQHRAKQAPGRDHETIIWETDTLNAPVYKRTVDGCIVYTTKKDALGL